MATFLPWREEVAKVSFRQAVVAEFVATFIFIFSTIGCVVFTQDGGITTARQTEVALIFGNAITILVFIFAGISGANINPAVSWGLFVSRKISGVRCLLYSIAQCLGAICGAGFVRIMTPQLFDNVDGGANEINPKANAREALGVEFGCTLLLVLTVMAATDSHRADAQKHIPTIAPIVVGLAVTAAHFIAVPVDNCSINPARSFGVSAISGNFNDHWVFWFGPYFGATAAALLYNYVFALHDEGDDKPAAAAAPRPIAAPVDSRDPTFAAAVASTTAPAAMFTGKNDAGSEAVLSNVESGGGEWR